jgi:hypothetical protein
MSEFQNFRNFIGTATGPPAEEFDALMKVVKF